MTSMRLRRLSYLIGVHSACGATDKAAARPFSAAMLVAVWWALRYVGAIMTSDGNQGILTSNTYDDSIRNQLDRMRRECLDQHQHQHQHQHGNAGGGVS